MTQKKDEAISKVMKDFEALANLVLAQLDQVEELLNLGNMELSEEASIEFAKNEKQIDALEVKLSERIVNTIVLYQPMASEIRHIFACYHIMTSLERIGDYAVHLANFLKSIKSLKVYNELSELINSMLQSSSLMLKKALTSFVQHDKETAIWVIKNDQVVDELNQKMLKKVIHKSQEFDEKKKVLISFITIKEMVDNIQRIADHATNIAEATIYYLEGKDIRHTPFFLE